MSVIGLRPEVHRILSEFGQELIANAPKYEWHIEMPESSKYVLCAILIVSPEGRNDIETVVVSLDAGAKEWELDAVNRDSIIIRGCELSSDQSLIEDSTSSAGIEMIGRALERWKSQILEAMP